MSIHIVQAEPSDKDFILHANREIDRVSDIALSALAKNIEKDVFEKKRAVCLLAKDDDRNIGMVLFSKVYWADRGQGIYVSQAFVEDEYRGHGVFKMLLEQASSFFPDTKFVTLLVAKGNEHMQDCVDGLHFEFEDMLSYVKNV